MKALSLVEYIRSDMLRYRRVDDQSIICLYLRQYGLQALFAYRLGRWLRSVRKRSQWWPLLLFLIPIQWLLTAYIRLAYDIRLHDSADLGPGIYFAHFGGIRLSNCRLGANCSIFQEVVIESLTGEGDGPEIGDNVWIGAHAKIRGPLRVGDGATIGAGASVVDNIRANCLALGAPARMIKRGYDNSGFL